MEINSKLIIDAKLLDMCRCCLKNNCSKDISSEYYFSGQKEIYSDMLRDTFNLQISHHKMEQLSCSMLICEDCVVRLRDAAAFKSLVISSELRFISYLNTFLQSGEDMKKTESCNLDLEMIKTEIPEMDVDSEVKCDDDSFDDDEILANIKMELTKEDAIVNSIKEKRRMQKKRVKLKEKEIKGNEVKSDTQNNWTKIVERRGDGPLLRQNSLKLLSNSTLCVFQWNKSRYRCFCCKEPFNDIDALREHNDTHNIDNIEKKIISQQNRLVKVEISNLFCKLCDEKIDDLDRLKTHLTGKHDVGFDSKEDLLVPFRIQNGGLKCQICFQSFDVFRLLNIHMNKHFQKQVCHICGAGFSNLVFLNLHKTRSHRPLKCQECGISFTSRVDKKHHEISVHGVKYERKLRFPCPYCPERFFQENFRVLHLVEKHGMAKPEHLCNVCQKTFITRSLLNNHVKNVHMKEKNHQCDVCHNLFYTKSDVSRHRVTHTGEKKYCCSVCNNNFATKDSLRRHMKRTHAAH